MLVERRGKKIASRSIRCDHWKGPGKLLLHLTNLSAEYIPVLGS